MLAVDDPRRALIRRAVFGAIWAAAVFFVFTATKEVKTVYGHSPWLNDPYDTVISFTMFFVPLVTACLLVQVSLCLRSGPLSTPRVVAIVRACRVVVGAVVVDLASAWLAVFLGANGSHWALGATGTEIGLLVVATAVAATAVAHLVRVPRLPAPAQLYGAGGPDWLGDAVTVVRRESRRLGPLRRIASGAADWAEHALVRASTPPSRWCCRHRECCLWRDGVRVAGLPGGLLLFGDAAGHGPRVLCDVRLPRPRRLLLWPCTWFPTGPAVRSADCSTASVAGCAAAIAALAFRNSLWWACREHLRCGWPVPVCRPDGWRGPSGFPGGCGARDGLPSPRSASPEFVSPTARHVVHGRRRPRRR